MAQQIIAAYDDQAIWGVGASAEAAIEDAAQWVDQKSADDLRATLKTAPMSDRLAAHVAHVGGNCAFEVADGLLVLALDD